ncbi:MAG: 50S ribosomal protein L18 [SAR202 cluster bacterium]|nr:50S ribosomal protein L18 [SAR202 cluster bacterium]
MAAKSPWAARKARHRRVRKHVSGTTERPRLAVFRSARFTYAQVIDDTKGHTLAAASSKEVESPEVVKAEAARQVGKLLAQRAKAAGISAVVFDRGGYLYHGRVKQVAEGAREEGLRF